MRIFGREIRRRSVPEERQSAPQSAPDFLQVLGLSGLANSAAGIAVTTDSALGVPAVLAAVNFLSGALAALPVNLFKETDVGRERVTDTPLAAILDAVANEEMTAFKWRKQLFESVFTVGRGLTFIERDRAGRVLNFWPLDPEKTKIKRSDKGAKFYEYRPGGGQKLVTYQSNEVIDLAFMLRADGLSHRGPIATARDVIALAIAATQFGSKFFQNGGVPPFAVTGNFQSGGAMRRSAGDLEEAVKNAAREGRQALVLPAGLEIKSLGVDAVKAQLVELKKFSIEEIARIYSLPPTFVQDLSRATFTNSEQQDLHLVKHTLMRWVIDFEQEMNLKVFGREAQPYRIKLNVDGILRGDFPTRMDGYAKAIQNGVMTPNEARALENRPPDPQGNQLMIQGATVPMGSQPAAAPITEGAGNAAT